MTTRRTILKAAGAVGAATIFSGVVPGLRAFAQTPPRVRRVVNNMALDDPDLETYREFVDLMQHKPPGNALSWLGFANQHGTNPTTYRFCPHGDWYFLPWHREFMLMYERAAATLMKNPKFAMPYWDWTLLRDYPPAFSEPKYKGKPNPLFVPNRNKLTGRNALTDAIVGPAQMQKIYKETAYEAFGTSRNPAQNNLNMSWVVAGGGFQGPLEGTTHNLVHNRIGAFMPQANSPRDPIFMMHHGNIDRIWAYWNALGRKNSDAKLWLDMVFKDNYLTPEGKPYSKTVKDLLSITPFGYTYDNMPPKPDNVVASPRRSRNIAALFDPAEKATPQRIKKANTKRVKPGEHLSMPFALQANTLKGVAETVAPDDARDVVALISNIDVGDDVSEIRVFVNHPAPTADTPDTDPHFVTSIAFLKHPKGGDHGAHKALPSAQVNLTDTLRKLSAGKELNTDNINVELVPVMQAGAPAAAASGVVPAAIEIAVV